MYNTLMLKPESMLEQSLYELKHTNVLLAPKRKERFVSKVPLNIDVWIERMESIQYSQGQYKIVNLQDSS